MTTITVNPDAAAVKSEPEELSPLLTDKDGRTLLVDPEIDVLVEARVVAMVGNEAAMNQVYMGAFVMPCLMVKEIDGVKILTPGSKREMEALIKQVGRPGINAIVEYLKARSPEDSEAGNKKLIRNPDFMDRCWLIHNGVPFEKVFEVSDKLLRHERNAMSIAFCIFNGNKFDTDNMVFEKPPAS